MSNEVVPAPAPILAALILVDVQNDFCPGGALAVPEGDQIIPIVNRLAPLFAFVGASQDWHPPNHSSFKEQGGDWPPHCLQGSRGAELHPDLDRTNIDVIAKKAFTPERDVFEALDAVEGSDPSVQSPVDLVSLDAELRRRGISTIYVAGLATDYCVRSTVLDALAKGYTVFPIIDAMRAVDVNPGDGAKAIAEMASKGAHPVTSAEILKEQGLSASPSHAA